MTHKSKRKVILVDGMTCTNCEGRIENVLNKIEGIIEVKAVYAESKVYIEFDSDKTDLETAVMEINKLGYIAYSLLEKNNISKNNQNRKQDTAGGLKKGKLIGIGVIILALYLIINNTIGFNFIPQVDQSMSYSLLFIVGLLTSIHCIAMCGGLNISQCIGHGENIESKGFSKIKPSLLYNAGRVISYTIIGGIVGALGSVVSFSGIAKGFVAVIAGVFMIVMGLNMLNIFPSLRRFTVRLLPKSISDKLVNIDKKHGAFYVGLLNGLMPCGPLQTMQLYALGTGSYAAGAFSMLAFSLGTVPLMFGLGAVSKMLSKNFTKNMMNASAVLVMILGFIMVGRGMSLSGISTNIMAKAEASPSNSAIARIESGLQTVTIDLDSNSYTPIIVQKGIPVRFVINADESNINGCNGEIYIPKFDKSIRIKPGENVLEFTPTEEGSIPYSCWMGMISSNISVVSDLSRVNNNDIEKTESNTSSGTVRSCCQ